MITQITNGFEALQAIQENFALLISKERSIPMAKEVNNTIGKMTLLVRLQALEKLRTDDKRPIKWLLDPAEVIELNVAKVITAGKKRKAV